MRELSLPRAAAICSVAIVAVVCAVRFGVALTHAEFGDVPDPEMSSSGTNGAIYATANDGTTLYVGGQFSAVGTITGPMVLLSKSTGEEVAEFPHVNAEVRAAVSDGSGGWYIGGNFTEVGGVTRNGLARILADGTLDTTFDPDINGSVFVLLLDGTTLYAGGGFTEVNGGAEERNGLAAFDATTGIATAFDPGLYHQSEGEAGSANALILDGTTLYVGGYFDEVNGGTTRNYLAAFDTGTGVVTAFDPDLDSSVYALVLDGTTLYAGGGFTEVNGGTTRIGVAAFDTGTGTATSFNPSIDGGVQVLLDAGGNVFAAGGFELIGAVVRHNIAAFDMASGAVTAFDADVDGSVTALALDGTTLYAGGGFTEVNGGTTRNYLAAFDTGTGVVTAFDPDPNAIVNTILLDGTTLYAGGGFTEVNGGTSRRRLASFDTSTGIATDFNPAVNGAANTLTLDGDTLYVGGGFNTVNQVHLAYTAAYSVSEQEVTADFPEANGTVYAAISDGAGGWYVGGDFTQIGGENRNHLAHILSDSSIDPSFDPDVDQYISALLLDGTTLYAAGDFTTVNQGTTPLTRNYLAAFDTTTGTATSFDPDPNNTVQDIVLDGTTLYAGGNFTTVNGGTPRNGIAAFDTTTGTATAFDPDIVMTSVLALALDGTGDTLYAGGFFNRVNGPSPTWTTRNSIAAFDTSTGLATAFDADIGQLGPPYNSTSGAVWDIIVDGSTVYAAGNFYSVNGSAANVRRNIASFDASTGAVTSFDPNVSSPVYTLHLDGTTLYAGGGFSTVNQGTTPLTRQRFAAFDTTTGVATSPNVFGGSGDIYVIGDNGGDNLFIGGDFDQVSGGITRNYLAAFDADTGTATSFHPDLDSSAYGLLLDGTTLYAGGDFTTVNQGTTPLTRNYLAAFDTTTGTATAFDPDTDAAVRALLLDGTTLYAGGDFTTVNQGTTPLTRNYLAAFDTTTGTATSFDPDFQGSGVQTLGAGSLIVGGEFQSADGGDSILSNLAIFPEASTPTPAATPSTIRSGGILPGSQLARLLGLQSPTPASGRPTPAQYGLREGDLISAHPSGDPDVYIVNEHGYRRLFLNPAIFSFYGHLGGYSSVRTVPPSTRDAFPVSGLFRNCETDDKKVYAAEITAEDQGILHHVDLSADQALSQDPDFFLKVFCINSNEFNWYPKGASLTSMSQLPTYRRQ